MHDDTVQLADDLPAERLDAPGASRLGPRPRHGDRHHLAFCLLLDLALADVDVLDDGDTDETAAGDTTWRSLAPTGATQEPPPSSDYWATTCTTFSPFDWDTAIYFFGRFDWISCGDGLVVGSIVLVWGVIV